MAAVQRRRHGQRTGASMLAISALTSPRSNLARNFMTSSARQQSSQRRDHGAANTEWALEGHSNGFDVLTERSRARAGLGAVPCHTLYPSGKRGLVGLPEEWALGEPSPNLSLWRQLIEQGL
jgi:hypothetical protein